MYCVFFGAMDEWPRLPVLLCIVLGACAAPEILEPRDGTVPPGLDLSGNWVMREIPLAERRRISDAIRKTDGVDDREVFGRPQQGRSRSRGGSRSFKGGLVYVFLETGSALKVTQTPHALFISFDRSVVEEFRFGENRIVSVGEVEAQRVTGWEGNQLVVETLDKNGMKLIERFQLLDGGDTLQRQITFRSKSLEEETIVQEFDRVD
jgi:hypothetical protein